MIITYIDSGVLLSATNGTGLIAEKALEILSDSHRVFAASEFVRLEVSPKAVYHQQPEEYQFYEEFFNDVIYWANDLTYIVQEAYKIASRYGLAAMDALHVAAAFSVDAEELITTEKKTKPMHKVVGIKVMSIFD
ncbi:PIN domain-containing protein [Dolichospermum sp. UHCC 0259]|uniref:type II toxin-antitoxin system VapC family toxin n=1 Tax=Dolichospermum sp. UHCC 0259 TaxID=2590010 RepID=UPI0014477893|nr:PIN domain-containing protein [Dolichospermum sp. UHCC 0259]MTJ48698.1 type II toxin-antitoxin system VapC family toxin [Dolichospermum sp. UHCC 0259]